MIKPEPTHAIYLDPEGEEPFDAILLPTAGHLGVIEEECDRTHLDVRGRPCPNCKAVV